MQDNGAHAEYEFKSSIFQRPHFGLFKSLLFLDTTDFKENLPKGLKKAKEDRKVFSTWDEPYSDRQAEFITQIML